MKSWRWKRGVLLLCLLCLLLVPTEAKAARRIPVRNELTKERIQNTQRIQNQEETDLGEEENETLFVILLSSLLGFALFCTIIIVIKKRRNKKAEDESLTCATLEEEKATVVIGQNRVPAPVENGETILLEQPVFFLKLKDTTTNQIYVKEFQEKVTVGRNPEIADLVIYNDRSISKLHFQIVAFQGQFYLEDLHSLNRTKLNGKVIEQPMIVQAGDLIQAGRSTFQIEELLLI